MITVSLLGIGLLVEFFMCLEVVLRLGPGVMELMSVFEVLCAGLVQVVRPVRERDMLASCQWLVLGVPGLPNMITVDNSILYDQIELIINHAEICFFGHWQLVEQEQVRRQQQQE